MGEVGWACGIVLCACRHVCIRTWVFGKNLVEQGIGITEILCSWGSPFSLMRREGGDRSHRTVPNHSWFESQVHQEPDIHKHQPRTRVPHNHSPAAVILSVKAELGVVFI